MNRLTKYLPWILVLASASLFYLPLGSRALWNSDEGRYAEIAREMLELKDWMTPHLNYVLYFEKPPLMYWLTAASVAVFGQNEFAARFWCAAFGLLTIGVVYLFGKRWKGERAGLLAGSLLATSLGFFLLTQFLALDMALTFWLTLALYASSRILQERPPQEVRRFTDLLALAVAGGVLTKGLVAAVFPILVLGLTVAYTRLWSQARKISWQPALILAAVLAAPWFVLMSVKHPFFAHFFFIREHLERFLTTVHHRTAPFYFFIPVLLGGFLPWSIFLPKVFISAFAHRRMAMKRDPVLALLILWSLFIFFFYSFSQSKLIGYILPILPALALGVAHVLDEALDEEKVPAWMERGVLALIVVWVAALAVFKLPLISSFVTDPAILAVRAHSDALCLILGGGVFVLVGVWGMRQGFACLGGILIVQVLLLSTFASLAGVLDPYLSNRAIAHILQARAQPEDRIVGYGVAYENVLQTLPFYTKRRIAVYGDPGELAMGREHAADAADWFTDAAESKAGLAKLPAGSWVVTNEEYEKDLSQSDLGQAFERAGREGQLLLLHKIR